MSARTFAEILKDSPSPSDVHVETALGNDAPRRRKPKAQLFAETIKGALGLPHPHAGNATGRAPKATRLPDKIETVKPGEADPIASRTVRTATGWAHKAAPTSDLYVHRPLANAEDLHAWAVGAGIKNVVPPDQMHVTQVYSRKPVAISPNAASVIATDPDRKIAPLGDKGAVVLHFKSPELSARFDEAMQGGATWDHEGGYKPHVTLSYDAGDTDLSKIKAPGFPLHFGPEVHEALNENWAEDSGLRVGKFSRIAKVAGVNDELGLVFGWAIVCTEKGEPYYDLNVDHAGEHAGKRVPEHITEASMLKAAAGFMQTPDRPGNEMHAGPETGSFVFAFPLTADVAKAMGITTEKTGLMVGYKPTAAVLAKFKSGEYSGFSIEGFRTESEEHD